MYLLMEIAQNISIALLWSLKFSKRLGTETIYIWLETFRYEFIVNVIIGNNVIAATLLWET